MTPLKTSSYHHILFKTIFIYLFLISNSLNGKSNIYTLSKEIFLENNNLINDNLEIEHYISQLSLEEKIAQLFVLYISKKDNDTNKNNKTTFLNKYSAAAIVYDDLGYKSKLHKEINTKKYQKYQQPLIGISIGKTNNAFLSPKELELIKDTNIINKYADNVGICLSKAETDFIWIDWNKYLLNKYHYTNILDFAQRLKKKNIATIAYMEDSKIVPDSLFNATFSGMYYSNNEYVIKNNGYNGFFVSSYLNNKKNVGIIKKSIIENNLLPITDQPVFFLHIVKEMVEKGEITENEIDAKIRKIIESKTELNKKNYKGMPSTLEATLEAIKENSIASCIQVKQKYPNVPITGLGKHRFWYKYFGTNNNTSKLKKFKRYLNHYVPLNEYIDKANGKRNTLFIPLFQSDFNNLTLSEKENAIDSLYVFSKNISEKNISLIWCFMGLEVEGFEEVMTDNDTVIMSPFTNEVAIKSIINHAFNGSGTNYSYNNGNEYETDSITNSHKHKFYTNRLSFSLPEEVGMDGYLLNEGIKSIVERGIKEKAFPGTQILVSRFGRIIYYEGFGHHTYDKSSPSVTEDTIFDLASLTKVVATNQVIMHLYAKDSLDIDKSLGYYVPELINTNKSNLIIKDILLHCAGLPPIIKVRKLLYDKRGRLKKKYFSDTLDEEHGIPLVATLYANEAAKEFIWEEIKKLPLRRSKYKRGAIYTYRYSDIGFFLLQRLCESITKTPLDQYVSKNLYDKIGASSLTFNPLEKGNKLYSKDSLLLNRIPPTEIDYFFRQGKIHGIVNDPLSAIMGGVAGHAGIFGTALDIAKVLELSRLEGRYGDFQFYDKETTDTFNRYYVPDVRRGLGWDKQHYIPSKVSDYSTIPEEASLNTFGHLGFTGAAGWVDPKKGLIFVFLSNRTYPNANNMTLQENEIRKKVFSIICKSIKSYELQNSFTKLAE